MDLENGSVRNVPRNAPFSTSMPHDSWPYHDQPGDEAFLDMLQTDFTVHQVAFTAIDPVAVFGVAAVLGHRFDILYAVYTRACSSLFPQITTPIAASPWIRSTSCSSCAQLMEKQKIDPLYAYYPPSNCAPALPAAADDAIVTIKDHCI